MDDGSLHDAGIGLADMLRIAGVGAVAFALLVAPTASARTFTASIAMTGVGTPASTYATVTATAQVTITLTAAMAQSALLALVAR